MIGLKSDFEESKPLGCASQDAQGDPKAKHRAKGPWLMYQHVISLLYGHALSDYTIQKKNIYRFLIIHVRGFLIQCLHLQFTRDISFSYPGSKNTTPALNKASLTIKSGQLVVLVGENRSGKSTIIRILSRLYNPTSGKIFIDGHASTDYHINDLCQATVILSQDSQLYPISIGENIGLGYAKFSSDKEMVMEAAEEGGALDFI